MKPRRPIPLPPDNDSGRRLVKEIDFQLELSPPGIMGYTAVMVWDYAWEAIIEHMNHVMHPRLFEDRVYIRGLPVVRSNEPTLLTWTFTKEQLPRKAPAPSDGQ